MTTIPAAGGPVPRDPIAFSIIDDMDTAIAVLYIGRNHGVTPQADACLRAVTVRCRDYLAQHRRAYAEVWAEARGSWLRPGSAQAPVPMAAVLDKAICLIEALVGDDRRAAEVARRNLRGPASILPQFRALLAKMSVSTD